MSFGSVVNAGLKGNRIVTTHQSATCTTTDTHCYDAGDWLASATQATGAITYGNRGNIVQLGSTTLGGDSLNQHVSTNTQTQTVNLQRDAVGNVIARTVTTSGTTTTTGFLMVAK